MTNEEQDLNARIIALIFGVLVTNKPFWAYVAVKPSAYPTFLEDQKNGKIDFATFEQYGEVIIAGEGNSPPEEVTLKVAEVYQTAPGELK